jgi:hypothetical protein
LLHEAGALCLKLCQPDEAACWFRNVLLLDPDHRPTRAPLAAYDRESGS